MGVTKIAINLERESGVFYAGEVVRGTVSFTVSSSVTCRGFQIHLVGKSHVHWHTGSGDSRTDYDGTTSFQDQRFTLHGNYFKTGVIQNGECDSYMYSSCRLLISSSSTAPLNIEVSSHFVCTHERTQLARMPTFRRFRVRASF